MRIVSRWLFCGLVLIITTAATNAQNVFPSRRLLDLTWQTTVKKSASGFDYIHRLISHPTSRQIVWSIRIDNRGTHGVVIKPSKWEVGGYQTFSSAMRDDGRSLELLWYAGTGRTDVARPINYPPVDSIEPGQTSPEFGVRGAPDPPGIVEWRVGGWAKVPVFDEERGVVISEGKEYTAAELGETFLTNPSALPNADFRTNVVSGFTLGPSTPDADPCQFLTTLGLDVIKAGEIGWIKPSDPAVGPKSGGQSGPENAPTAAPRIHLAEGLAAKILNVRTPCQKGQYEPASRLLSAVLNENCALRGQQINEEAYLLIRYSVEYLLEKFGHPELAPSCEAPTGSLAVHVTTTSAKGKIINAQGVDVTVTSKDGTVVKTGKTGWGASSGEAVFENLVPGEYTIAVKGKTATATISRDQRAKAAIKIK